MDKSRIEGALGHAKGSVNEAIGKVTGCTGYQADEMAGRASPTSAATSPKT